MDQEHLLHDLQQAAIELAHKQYAEAVGKRPVIPTNTLPQSPIQEGFGSVSVRFGSWEVGIGSVRFRGLVENGSDQPIRAAR